MVLEATDNQRHKTLRWVKEKVSEMFVFLALLLIVALILAERYGTDSRDGRDWASTADRRPATRDIVSSRS